MHPRGALSISSVLIGSLAVIEVLASPVKVRRKVHKQGS